MKKKLILLSVLILCTAFFGCKKTEDPEPSKPESSNVSNEPLTAGNQNPLTGTFDLADEALGQKPVSIMVSNIKIVKDQQYGLTDADICFETIAEAGITRIEAVYADVNKIQTTGPVRSVREYFVDFAAPLHPIFVHWGGSYSGYTRLNSSGLHTIDGMSFGASFIQDENIAQSKGKEHSQFINGKIIQQLSVDLELDTSGNLAPVFDFMTQEEAEAFSFTQAASHIIVPFSDSTISTYMYDESIQRYKKGQFGQEHIDANNGEVIYVDNVMILFTSIISTNDDAGRMTVGLESGNGYYAAMGGVIPIKWTKGGIFSSFAFTDQDGNPLKIAPGKSWISLVPYGQESNVSFE